MTTRLFVSAPLGNGVSVRLNAEQARYLSRVLRARIGDSIFVFNGDDGEWSATIETIGKKGIDIRIEAPRERASESVLRTHLVQGVSRGERMDLVVQKATELGVKRLSPVLTEFGVVKLDAKRAARRREHWQRVAENACEQCGRIRPPRIDPPLALDAWLGARDAEGSTQLILKPDAPLALADVPAPETKLCLLIGPEGGFSEREYENASAGGFDAVALGPRVLRTETAAIVALSVAQALWGDFAPS